MFYGNDESMISDGRSTTVEGGTTSRISVTQHPTPTRTEGETFKVYATRWFVLAIVVGLSFSNAMMWQPYTALTSESARYFCDRPEEGKGCEISTWTAMIYQICGCAFGIIGMYVTDRHGIRPSTLIGSTFNLVGSVFRVVSSVPSLPLHLRQPFFHTGTALAATAQPFFLVLSPKVAECWFPANSRALANVLSFIANPLGTLLGSLVPIPIVKADVVPTDYDFLWLNGVMLVVPALTFMFALCLRRSTPPSPPSPSQLGHNPMSTKEFFKGILACFKTPQFYVIFVVFGIAFAQLWSFFVRADNMFSEIGYSRELVAYLIMAATFFGTIGAIAAGAYVDRTKRFKEVVKVCMIGFTLCAFGMNFFCRHIPTTAAETLVPIVIMAVMGICSVTVFPIGIELGIEATFPVQEATSSGILAVGSQLTVFIVICIMEMVRETSVVYTRDGSTGWPKVDANYWFGLDVWCGISTFGAILALVALRPKYKRIEFELTTTEKIDR